MSEALEAGIRGIRAALHDNAATSKNAVHGYVADGSEVIIEAVRWTDLMISKNIKPVEGANAMVSILSTILVDFSNGFRMKRQGNETDAELRVRSIKEICGMVGSAAEAMLTGKFSDGIEGGDAIRVSVHSDGTTKIEPYDVKEG